MSFLTCLTVRKSLCCVHVGFICSLPPMLCSRIDRFSRWPNRFLLNAKNKVSEWFFLPITAALIYSSCHIFVYSATQMSQKKFHHPITLTIKYFELHVNGSLFFSWFVHYWTFTVSFLCFCFISSGRKRQEQKEHPSRVGLLSYFLHSLNKFLLYFKSVTCLSSLQNVFGVTL